jgi:hypothetical protein
VYRLDASEQKTNRQQILAHTVELFVQRIIQCNIRKKKMDKELLVDVSLVTAQENASVDSFCCAVCLCSPDRIQHYRALARVDDVQYHSDSLLLQTHDGGVWHRRCCHGVEHAVNWLAPMDIVDGDDIDFKRRRRSLPRTATATAAAMADSPSLTGTSSTSPKYSYEECDIDFVRNEIGKAAKSERRLWREDESPGKRYYTYINKSAPHHPSSLICCHYCHCSLSLSRCLSVTCCFFLRLYNDAMDKP